MREIKCGRGSIRNQTVAPMAGVGEGGYLCRVAHGNQEGDDPSKIFPAVLRLTARQHVNTTKGRMLETTHQRSPYIYTAVALNTLACCLLRYMRESADACVCLAGKFNEQAII